MDPYTEQLIERSRQRREMLNQKLGKTPEAAPRKRRTPLSEDLSSNVTATSDSVVQNDDNDDSPKRQCTRDYEQQIKPDTPAIGSVKSRLHALASERTHWSDTSDSEHNSKAVSVSKESYTLDTEMEAPKPRKGRLALAALAQDINTWEDDFSHHTSTQKENYSSSGKPHATSQPASNFKSTKTYPPPAPPCPKQETSCGPNSPKKFHAPQPPMNNNNSRSVSVSKFHSSVSPVKSQLTFGTLQPSSPSPAKVARPLQYVASVKGSPTKDGRRLTEQIPVNSRGLNESPTTDEQTDDEPTMKPVADRFAKWAKKTESFKSTTEPPKTPLSSRVASWEQKVSQTPKSQTSVQKVTHTPRQMCTPVSKSRLRECVPSTPVQNTPSAPAPPASTGDVDPAMLPVSARMAKWQEKTAAPPVEEEPTAYSVIARMSAWEHMSSNNQVCHIKKVDPSLVIVSPSKQIPDKPPAQQVPRSPSVPKAAVPSKIATPSKPLTPTKSFKESISEQIQQMKSGQSPGPKSPQAVPPKSPAKTMPLSPSNASNSMKTVHQRLMEQTHSSSKSKEIENKIRQERMAELRCIQNRWKNGILKEESSTDKPGPAAENASAVCVEQVKSASNAGSHTPNKRDAIRAIAREDFDRKLAAMGFDVSDDSPSASFNFKKGGRSYNQQQAGTNGQTPPPAPKLPNSEKKSQQSAISHAVPQVDSSSMYSAKPPLPTPASCQKSRSNSIYRIIAKKDEFPQQQNQLTLSQRSQEQSQAPVIQRRVQFEDSFDSTDDNDTSDNAPSSRDDTTDAPSRDESQESFDETEMDESESDRPQRRAMPNVPQQILDEDDGDDVSLSAFVPASVRRESIIPNRPDTEQNQVLDTSFDSFDEPRQPAHELYSRRMVPPQYGGAGAQESSSSLTSTESESVSEGCYRVRDQRKFNDTYQEDDRNDINDLLDEAMDEEMGDDDEDDDGLPVPAPRHGQQRNEASKTNVTSPLIYSISMYRSKKFDRPDAKMSIVRNSDYTHMDVKEENIPMPTSYPPEEQRKSLHERIQELQELVKQEQSVICQTSNALNQCCASNSYFAGSAEQVECNRLLLIACQKRQSYLLEISRLKDTRNLDPAGPGPKGSLTISDIRLPLKKDFVTKIGTGQDNMVYYFILLIRNNAQVICTQMLSTHDPMMRGSLDFPNLIKLNGITANFRITIDIYGMSVSKENSGKEKKKKTPKKQRGYGVSVQSPGGPNAVRTTSFSLITTVPLDMKALDKTCFNLDRLPYLSPLHGTIYMRLKCLMEANVEERGFLTMFEDVSGLGAWHRRWVVLARNKLCFWKYPDDENKKDPIGFIDLKRCITEKVGLIPRDICARPNTFEVVTVRQPRRGERDTLVSKTYNTLTTMKHMMSADTKEERIVWCNMINRTLANIRTWHSDAMRPIRLSDNQ
ncbi:anillin-like isoform X2 [Gigantopelta aegis]|uniref:anillin-like isoform X2 n=1 Tax=Gigantopelta aegis TaxID=1735272 RepID=UPI001B88CC3D|nr:anillin-like isoform X2 [Gigantopelta aegis]